MAAPYDPTDVRIRISSTENGTYSNLAKTRSFNYTEGSEGDTTIRWFGGEAAIAGDETVTASFDLVRDRGDTLGQEIALAAKRSGATVFLQICPEGAGTGKKCEQFGCVITEFNMSADADGDYVAGSMSVRGDASTLTTITLA